MSMREYGVNDYGLLLTEDTVKLLASKICDDYAEEKEYLEDASYCYDVVEEKLEPVYISEFSGDAVVIRHDGSDDWSCNCESFYCDTIYYIPLDKYPTLFDAAYKDMDEIVMEMELKLDEYLPIDFDYKNAIRHIVGTYYV